MSVRRLPFFDDAPTESPASSALGKALGAGSSADLDVAASRLPVRQAADERVLSAANQSAGVDANPPAAHERPLASTPAWTRLRNWWKSWPFDPTDLRA